MSYLVFLITFFNQDDHFGNASLHPEGNLPVKILTVSYGQCIKAVARTAVNK
jgi:hypothetical protein